MQKGKGFFRLVVAVSILVFITFFLAAIFTKPEPEKPAKLTPMEIDALVTIGKLGLSSSNYSELNDFYNLDEQERRKVLAIVGKERQSLVDFYELPEIEKERVLYMLSADGILKKYNVSLEVEPIGEHILIAMFTGVVAVIPIWIVYGLTIYVVRGFKGQKKGSRSAKR